MVLTVCRRPRAPLGFLTCHGDCRKRRCRCSHNVIPGVGSGVHHTTTDGRRVTSRLLQTSGNRRLALSTGLLSNDRTHVKDLNNFVDAQLPCSHHPSTAIRMEALRGCTPFAPLGWHFLNICCSPVSEITLMGSSKRLSPARPTSSIDSLHHARTGRARPASFCSSLRRTLNRCWRRVTRVLHNLIRQSLSPSWMRAF